MKPKLGYHQVWGSKSKERTTPGFKWSHLECNMVHDERESILFLYSILFYCIFQIEYSLSIQLTPSKDLSCDLFGGFTCMSAATADVKSTMWTSVNGNCLCRNRFVMLVDFQLHESIFSYQPCTILSNVLRYQEFLMSIKLTCDF